MSNCLFDTSTCIFHLSFWRHGSEELRARGAAEFCMSRAKQKMATAFSLAFSREKNLLSAAMLSFSACCTLPFGFLTLVGTPLSIQEFMIPNKFPKTNPLQLRCKTDFKSSIFCVQYSIRLACHPSAHQLFNHSHFLRTENTHA